MGSNPRGRPHRAAATNARVGVCIGDGARGIRSAAVTYGVVGPAAATVDTSAPTSPRVYLGDPDAHAELSAAVTGTEAHPDYADEPIAQSDADGAIGNAEPRLRTQRSAHESAGHRTPLE